MTKRQLFVLITTIVGSAIAFLDGMIVNLALPKIGIGLHTGFSGFQWVVDGYLLSLSALILLGGSLGDIYGRKKVYLTGLVGFGISSLFCAIAPTIGFLIVVRLIQGVFGALLVPGALSILNTNFPRNKRGRAIGLWTAFGAIASVVAPLVGGIILDVATWRWIFLINLPLMVLCLLFGLPSIKETRDKEKRRVDVWGALVAALALAGVTYGLIEGPGSHWAFRAVAALVLGLVLIPVFIKVERTEKDPMVDLSLFRSRNFTGANIMTFATYGALSGFVFALVIYLQTKLGYSSLQAGFALFPVSILIFTLSGRVGALSAKYGPRLFMTFGPMLVAAGMFLLYFLKPGDSYWLHIFPGAVLFGLGMALTVAPLTTTVMTSVDESESGIASGINNALSRVAGLIVVAVLGLLGASQVYRFALGLAAAMALTAGFISFAIIRNVRLHKN